jgi:hypothetical protein
VSPASVRVDDIARSMRMSVEECWELARHADTMYKAEDWRGTPSGKLRLIDPPTDVGYRRLVSLHDFIQHARLFHPAAHGGVKRRSCFTSATVHCGRRFVWNRDVSDCYPSITPDMLFHQLRVLGFRPDVCNLLAMLLTVRGRVPQGSPSSGDALNLFLWMLDQTMASLCGRCGLRYTRVADDVVISGDNRNAGFAAVELLEAKLEEMGLRVNIRKREESGFQPASARQRVHNIQVNDRRGTTIVPEQWEKATDVARGYVRGCRSAQPSTLVRARTAPVSVASARRRSAPPEAPGPRHNAVQGTLVAPIK